MTVAQRQEPKGTLEPLGLNITKQNTHFVLFEAVFKDEEGNVWVSEKSSFRFDFKKKEGQEKP